MNDSDRLVKLALAAGKVIDLHNKAAAEMEPGFTCGCKTVCRILLDSLEEVGLTDRKVVAKMAKASR